MDAVVWVIGIVVGLVIVVAVLTLALRGMRPKLPAPQVFAPAPTTPRTAASTAAPASSALTPDVVAEIDRLVAANQKIHAIKLYRDHTGVGLKEAKDRIEHWSASTTAPHQAPVSHAAAARSALPAVGLTPSTVRASLPASTASEIDALVAGGAAIAAIKLLRQHTGLGLKESKDLIDTWGTGGR
ncbi:ribosomal protein L7/L12 [Microbacterium sp. Se5.02b]|uniref:ribosomal protein L7/L12 n=1 Tax=Microbacterium sp. Se5.02b TaxID=2864103 RepID=UPI001C691292|nr:ribosomal protein L7/L12 [Microbacterium sp. Se5.02b]QYM64038.1 ribosomal protein L7/L12 [Microbacterium sp. Se5.02b]